MADRLFNVKVKPNSKKEEITIDNDNINAKVNAPPVEGEANKRLIELLSEFLGCPKSNISIISGHKSKNKRVLIKE